VGRIEWRMPGAPKIGVAVGARLSVVPEAVPDVVPDVVLDVVLESGPGAGRPQSRKGWPSPELRWCKRGSCSQSYSPGRCDRCDRFG
jgi:hypothetical protein